MIPVAAAYAGGAAVKEVAKRPEWAVPIAVIILGPVVLVTALIFYVISRHP